MQNIMHKQNKQKSDSDERILKSSSSFNQCSVQIEKRGKGHKKHAAPARIRVQKIQISSSNLWLLVDQVVQDVPVVHDRAGQVDQLILLSTQ
jgi:hypothetical protein